jgi:hypothetical protein
LKILSNKAEPYSFYYEIIGDSYDHSVHKNTIMLLNDTYLRYVDGVDLVGFVGAKTEQRVKDRYKKYLIMKPEIKKLPYIYTSSYDVNDSTSFFRDRGDLTAPFNSSVLRDINLRKHNKSSELLLSMYQKGADIKQFGRLKGNMQYMEDI